MPPIGWYLAQRLTPVVEDLSDDDEVLTIVPNGQVVCGTHGLAACPRCEIVLEASNDSDDEEIEDDEADGVDDDRPIPSPTTLRRLLGVPELKKGSGLVFAAKFVPPTASILPLELFSVRMVHMSIIRAVHRNDASKVLICTDGACLNNGQSNPRAGWGFFQGFRVPSGELSTIQGHLETKGPWGDNAPQTSNRAELRAVITALRFRHWPGEGFRTMVIATDSEYVVEGSTNWARGWVANNWRSSGGYVKNKDLWEVLLGEFERWKDQGLTVEFWKIPRKWNTIADAAARKGAEEDAVDEWRQMLGMAF